MDKMNQNGSASFSYTGTDSAALGLVGSMTGSGHVASQSYQYDSKNWLSRSVIPVRILLLRLDIRILVQKN